MHIGWFANRNLSNHMNLSIWCDSHEAIMAHTAESRHQLVDHILTEIKLRMHSGYVLLVFLFIMISTQCIQCIGIELDLFRGFPQC